jgi:hypothetical protein
MKKHFKYSSTIENYLSDDMDYAEKKSFEKELTKNRELSDEFFLTKSIDAAISREDILDLRTKLINARNEAGIAKSGNSGIRSLWRRYWYAAASLILLASIGGYFLLGNKGSYSNDRLFNQYYSPDNLINITRSSDANIVEALIKYQEKDYVSSVRLFTHILQNDSANYAGWFYYGISCIETSNFKDAESAFNRIINNEGNLYAEHAEWYLALNFIKSNQMEKARIQLEKIAGNPENFHRKDARQLLKQMDKVS